MLKSLLSLLLSKFYSKQESEVVGHQALPSTSKTTLFTNKSITNWGTVASGVAASDGFLKLQSNGSGSTTASIFIRTPSLTSIIQYPFETAGGATWVPIAKGESWDVQGSDSTSISLYLFKTIGGGYQSLKRFVQKGVCLCLSLSFNYLQKPSSKAKNRGLVFRDYRQLRRQSYPQQWTQHGELMSLLRTAMWFFKAEHLSSSCITRLEQALIMGASRISLEDLFRFERAVLCTITSKVRTAPQDSPLLHVSLSNLVKGGSLC